MTETGCAPKGISRAGAAAPFRIVVIGGGTGLSTLLHGLKIYTAGWAHKPAGPKPRNTPEVEISAIITVTDDGGSSGRLRREFEVLPPGDIRNCMVALSEDEALLSKLFQYRFASGRGLKGHSFGNLFLTALSHVTGDFPTAVKVTSEVLAIAGRIYPATASNVVLEARLENGVVVSGETRISRSKSKILTISLKPRECSPIPETLQAIASADLITLGPGSLYTSIIPNLLVKGIPEAIESSPAVKAYFVNLMWQPRETLYYTASDHVRALLQHARRNILDYVIVNNRPISSSLQRKYAAQVAKQVENDVDKITGLGVKVIARDLLQESDTVRHSPESVAALMLELAELGRKGRQEHQKKAMRVLTAAGRRS